MRSFICIAIFMGIVIINGEETIAQENYPIRMKNEMAEYNNHTSLAVPADLLGDDLFNRTKRRNNINALSRLVEYRAEFKKTHLGTYDEYYDHVRERWSLTAEQERRLEYLYSEMRSGSERRFNYDILDIALVLEIYELVDKNPKSFHYDGGVYIDNDAHLNRYNAILGRLGENAESIINAQNATIHAIFAFQGYVDSISRHTPTDNGSQTNEASSKKYSNEELKEMLYYYEQHREPFVLRNLATISFVLAILSALLVVKHGTLVSALQYKTRSILYAFGFYAAVLIHALLIKEEVMGVKFNIVYEVTRYSMMLGISTITFGAICFYGMRKRSIIRHKEDALLSDAVRYAEEYLVVKHNDDLCIYNTKGDITGIITKVEEYGALSCGLIPVRRRNTWRYYDINGKLSAALNGIYRRASDLSEDTAVIEDQNGVKILTISGEVICKMEIQDAKPCTDGVIAVKVGDTWGYMDKDGEWIVEPRYHEAGMFRHGYAAVAINGVCGLVDKNGTEHLDEEIEEIDHFSDDRLFVKKYGRWGVLNNNLALVVRYQYDEYRAYHSGNAFVKRQDLWTLIGKDGSERGKQRYENVGDYAGGHANVKINGRWGYIDINGDVVIATTYSYASVMACDRAIVKDDDGVRVIDGNNTTVYSLRTHVSV